MTTKKAAMIEQPRRRRVTFQCAAGRKSDVRLAGDFHQWSTSTHRVLNAQGNLNSIIEVK